MNLWAQGSSRTYPSTLYTALRTSAITSSSCKSPYRTSPGPNNPGIKIRGRRRSIGSMHTGGDGNPKTENRQTALKGVVERVSLPVKINKECHHGNPRWTMSLGDAFVLEIKTPRMAWWGRDKIGHIDLVCRVGGGGRSGAKSSNTASKPTIVMCGCGNGKHHHARTDLAIWL